MQNQGQVVQEFAIEHRFAPAGLPPPELVDFGARHSWWQHEFAPRTKLLFGVTFDQGEAIFENGFVTL